MGMVGLDFETFKDRLTFTLSGGEKRKVALAAMLALQPKVLLLDEPTAGLDPQSRKELIQHLHDLRTGGMTFVISSHHMEDLAALTERLLVLHQGQVAMTGSLGEVFCPPGRIAGVGACTAARRPHCRWTAEEWLAYSGGRGGFAGIGKCPGRNERGRAMSNFEFMQRMTFGQYLPTGSPLHSLDARARIVIFSVFLTAVTVVKGIPGLVLSLLLACIGLVLARVPLGYALKGLLPPLPFLAILAVIQVFMRSRGTETALIQFWVLRVTMQGLLEGIVLLLRFAALVLWLSLSSFTLSISDLILGLNLLLRPLGRLGLPVDDLVLMVQGYGAVYSLPDPVSGTDCEGAGLARGSLGEKAVAACCSECVRRCR